LVMPRPSFDLELRIDDVSLNTFAHYDYLVELDSSLHTQLDEYPHLSCASIFKGDIGPLTNWKVPTPIWRTVWLHCLVQPALVNGTLLVTVRKQGVEDGLGASTTASLNVILDYKQIVPPNTFDDEDQVVLNYQMMKNNVKDMGDLDIALAREIVDEVFPKKSAIQKAQILKQLKDLLEPNSHEL